MKTARDIYKESGWKGLFKATREGWREGGGTRALLGCFKYDWTLWVGIVWGIVMQEFVIMAVVAVVAAIGATFREWTNRSYVKFLDGYGTMVDRQQKIIGAYQTDEFVTHQSQKAAQARLN